MNLDNGLAEQEWVMPKLGSFTPDPIFTSDWFSNALINFDQCIKYLNGPVDRILEIGSHEGRSTCWMLENMLTDTGTITCIDPFANAPLSAFSGDTPPALRIIEHIFRSNVEKIKKPEQTVNVMPTLSFPALAQLIVDKAEFDFIYVDGSHHADDALADAVMSFGLLKSGGVMLFDDYMWDHVPDHLQRPKMSIDAFVNMFINKVTVKFINYQLALVKN